MGERMGQEARSDRQRDIRVRQICIAVLILLAYFMRIYNKLFEGNMFLAYLRSFIYIGLFAEWGFSLQRRILQTQVRCTMLVIAGAIVFWIVVRFLKYNVFNDVDILRRMWYSYYIPLVLIPTLSLFVALSLGKAEDYRMPLRHFLLLLPAAALILLVLSNDLHCLCFRFPEGGVWTDKEYAYGPAYILVMGWNLAISATAFVILYKKCRVPGSRERILLPLIPYLFIWLYLVLYLIYPDWFAFLFGDMPVVVCLAVIAVFEGCIHAGLLRSNTGYEELLFYGNMKMQILDMDGRVYDAARAVPVLQPEEWREILQKGISGEGGDIVHRGHLIHGGLAVWEEDVSEINAVLKQLQENREALSEQLQLEQEIVASRQKARSLQERSRLYERLWQLVRSQTAQIRLWLKKYEEARAEEEKRTALGYAAVVTAYVKRRSNLFFQEEKEDWMPLQELGLCLQESFENLRLAAVDCGMELPEGIQIRSAEAARLYETFESILEKAMGTTGRGLAAVWVKAEVQEECLQMRIFAESEMDLRECGAYAGTDEDGVALFLLETER